VTAVSALLVGWIAGSLVGQPDRVIWSGSQTTRVWGSLHIEVTPMGYPLPGKPWIINVYTVHISSGNVTLRPSSNSTILVNVRYDGFGQSYDLPVNTEGQATFDFLPEYSDVAFQAFSGDQSSEKLVLSTHYASSETVDSLISLNGLLSVFSIANGVLTLNNKKMKKVRRFTSVAIICVFAFVCLFSLYSRLFQGTIWGYPENLIDGIVTLTLLKYATVFGVIALVVFPTLSFVFSP
jgi:hypothetical protein